MEKRAITPRKRRSFYADQVQGVKPEDLEEALSRELEGEILLMRVSMRRLMELADGVESLPTAIKVLSALGTASSHLAQLLKTQKLLEPQKNQAADALSQALSEVAREMKLR